MIKNFHPAASAVGLAICALGGRRPCHLRARARQRSGNGPIALGRAASQRYRPNGAATAANANQLTASETKVEVCKKESAALSRDLDAATKLAEESSREAAENVLSLLRKQRGQL